MFTEKFMEVLKNEGVVSIVTWTDDEPHLVNSWNSYLVITEDNKILIPAYAMRTTEKNLLINKKFKMSLGSKNVLGYNDYPGTGFIVDGSGSFIDSGKDFDMMKDKFSFLTRVLVLNINSAKQML
ncbi:MAG: hypothetical protein WBA54_12525 [Acidaminobacteraceae bacterium]